MRISDWSSDVCSSDLSRLASSDWSEASRSFDAVSVSLPSADSSIFIWMMRRSRLSISSGFDSTSMRMRLAASSIRRSEEHTSELQSLLRNSYAVFCLKKKNNTGIKTELKHTSKHQE